HAALLIYTDKPRQRFVIVDVVGELDRIKNLDYAGVNEYSANDKIENAPKNLHVTCHPSLVTRHSSLLLHPSFPAAIENEDPFHLGLIAQTFRDVARGIATLGAAINDNFFLRRPVRQKWRQ